MYLSLNPGLCMTYLTKIKCINKKCPLICLVYIANVFIRVTSCPATFPTAQHFHPPLCIPHTEMMSHNLVSFSFQRSNHCRTDVFLKPGLYPIVVKKVGKAVIARFHSKWEHVGVVLVKLSSSFLLLLKQELTDKLHLLFYSYRLIDISSIFLSVKPFL